MGKFDSVGHLMIPVLSEAGSVEVLFPCANNQ